MRAIEKAAAALAKSANDANSAFGASAQVISVEDCLPDARAAVLAFLEGVDAHEIGFAAAAIRDRRDCDKAEAVLAALRAEAGASDKRNMRDD